MGISAKDIIRGFLAKGFRIGWSSGRPFDPSEQVRTSAFEDFQKQKEKEDDKKTVHN